MSNEVITTKPAEIMKISRSDRSGVATFITGAMYLGVGCLRVVKGDQFVNSLLDELKVCSRSKLTTRYQVIQ